MTNQEIINLARYQLDDTVEDYKWSDVELVMYLNDAQAEACRRTYLLINYPSVVKVTGVSNITFALTGSKITKATGGFLSSGETSEVNTFEKDDQITITGTVSNNGVKTIVSVSDTEIVVSEALVNESNVSAVIEATRTVYRIPVNANINTYRLHPKTVSVVRARLNSLNYPLLQRSLSSLDYDIGVVDSDINYDYYSWYCSSWETLTNYPYAFLEEAGSVRIISPPITDDILLMVVARLPKKEFTTSAGDLASSPEIAVQYHSDLVDWMLRLAFLKPDSEIQDLARATFYENKFTDKFGERPSTVTESNRRRFPPNMSTRHRELGF
jgi:hypothetical protein